MHVHRLRPTILLAFLSLGRAQDFSTSTFLLQPSAQVTALRATLPPLITQSITPIPSRQPPLANTLILSPSPIASEHLLPPAQLPEGYARTASGKPIPCSPRNTRLNPSSHKLISDCVETSFCWAPPGSRVNATGLGVCIPRRCRRDEFPSGYGMYGGGSGGRLKVKGASTTNPGIELPPLCTNGSYCPDNGSGCQLQVPVGERCELARDEQCMPPPPNPEVAGKDYRAICLKMTCTPATLPLKAPCTFENTTYVSDMNRGAAGGGQMTTFIFRHNCLAPGLFCDPTPSNAKGPTCQKTKKRGEKCRFDAECEMNNCASPANICTLPSMAPIHLAPWHWVATILFTVVALASTVFLLLFLQRRRRYMHHQQMKEYYHEQVGLRRSLLALHAAASEHSSGEKVGVEKKAIKEELRIDPR